ncbi:MAG: zinc ribbon domain-containing protein [Clostridia bacterium]|nr:zinc ribbon domain-containing protein [Clostridia bacterium]
MNTEAITCPACGAPLATTQESEFIFCEYCGSAIRIKRTAPPKQNERIMFVEPASKLLLGSAVVKDGFQISGGLTGQSSAVYPITALCTAYNLNGTVMIYTSGEGFTDRSKCPSLSGIYAVGLNSGINKVVYRDFQEAAVYCDAYMEQYAKNGKASSIRYIETREYPIVGFDETAGLELFKQQTALDQARQAPGVQISGLDYYYKPICRIYEMDVNQLTFRIAMATVVRGVKYRFPTMPGLPSFEFGGVGNWGRVQNQGDFSDISDVLFGNSILGRAMKKRLIQSEKPKQEENRKEKSNTAVNSFGQMPLNYIIDWDSFGVFLLQALPENFEAAYADSFICFCSTYQVSRDFSRRIYDLQNQIVQNINSYTQQNLQQQRQNFENWQRINVSMQAAYDSYNQAWFDRINAHHQAFRQQSQQAFNGSYGGTGDFAEAIRGVNTYIRPDGTEVEVSVDYDRAFTNASGDTFGTNASRDTYDGWTEMRRK